MGFDPIEARAPQRTFAFRPAAKVRAAPEDLQREIVEMQRQCGEKPQEDGR